MLRRLCARAAEGRPTVNRADNARGRISQATRFLAWLRSQHASLATCQQAHINRWFADNPGFADALATRRQARSFLAWAIKQHALVGVGLPLRQQRGAAQATDPEQRWALARRLLHDDQLKVADRVAGLLVVLYAQPASRIVRLTVAEVVYTAEQTFLRLGHDQVLMPEPLGGLVRELPTHRPVGMAGRLHASSASTWLFTGRQPDRPLHPQHLIRRLAVLGIPSRATRNAALLQLAAELPPTVLADMLGLHRHRLGQGRQRRLEPVCRRPQPRHQQPAGYCPDHGTRGELPGRPVRVQQQAACARGMRSRPARPALWPAVPATRPLSSACS